MNGYVDIKRLLPQYEERTCWNCGNAWLREARPTESICRECFMGQGDNSSVDEPTDYGELWYGDVSREEKQRRYEQTRRTLTDGVLLKHVDVAATHPATVGLLNTNDRGESA